MADINWNTIRPIYDAWRSAESAYWAQWEQIVVHGAEVDLEVLDRLSERRVEAKRDFMEAAKPLTHG